MTVAVVTGGIKGIGYAMSRRLVKLGYQVVALYREDDVTAQAVSAELSTLRVDLSDPDAVAEAGRTILTTHGTPRVLVHNAGRNIDRPFLEMATEDWQAVLDTNLSGVFHLTKALAPAMLATGEPGVIVTVGATTGIRPRPNGVNYCASKAGLLQLTKCLALELAPQIRVNCLIPGMTETAELVRRYRLDDPEARARVAEEIPLRRIGTVEDVADALEFLVTPQSSYLTGQKIIVDGGQFMW
jgi:acetoacetyl-CoA reductase/3-oxoacyl-[acyl-carrier protein] reductase